MTTIIISAIIILCLSIVIALFGCENNKKKSRNQDILDGADMYKKTELKTILRKKYMLDGPGMENEPKWTSFTISQTSSYAQHNFSLDVVDDGNNVGVSGVCRDDNGNEYQTTDLIKLRFETIATLRQYDLDNLSDFNDEKTEIEDELICLDADEVSLSLFYEDGRTAKKCASSLAIPIYKLLIPYFVATGSKYVV